MSAGRAIRVRTGDRLVFRDGDHPVPTAVIRVKDGECGDLVLEAGSGVWNEMGSRVVNLNFRKNVFCDGIVELHESDSSMFEPMVQCRWDEDDSEGTGAPEPPAPIVDLVEARLLSEDGAA